MRLIDADKVIVTRNDYEKALTLEERLHRLLNNQPTVEAIPIEWLKKKLDKEVEKYYDLGLDTLAKQLKYLIIEWFEDWEKENAYK